MTLYFLIPEYEPTNLMRMTADGALWRTDENGEWVQSNSLEARFKALEYIEISPNEAALWAKKFFPGKAVQGLDPLYELNKRMQGKA